MERRWWVRPTRAKSSKSSANRSAKPLPSPERGAFPRRSHSHQSDVEAAPSHCVDDAPVPHLNSLGHCTDSSMARSGRKDGPIEGSVMGKANFGTHPVDDPGFVG